MRIAAVVIALLIAGPAFADHRDGDEADHGASGHKMDHQSHCGLPAGEGVIVSVNAETAQLVIDHKPIDALDMGAMTMGFATAKGVDLSPFSTGEKVHFLIEPGKKEADRRVIALCSLDVSAGAHQACMKAFHNAAMKAAGKACAETAGAAHQGAHGDHAGSKKKSAHEHGSGDHQH